MWQQICITTLSSTNYKLAGSKVDSNFFSLYKYLITIIVWDLFQSTLLMPGTEVNFDCLGYYKIFISHSIEGERIKSINKNVRSVMQGIGFYIIFVLCTNRKKTFGYIWLLLVINLPVNINLLVNSCVFLFNCQANYRRSLQDINIIWLSELVDFLNFRK